jgi:hypothetical protein
MRERHKLAFPNKINLEKLPQHLATQARQTNSQIKRDKN